MIGCTRGMYPSAGLRWGATRLVLQMNYDICPIFMWKMAYGPLWHLWCCDCVFTTTFHPTTRMIPQVRSENDQSVPWWCCDYVFTTTLHPTQESQSMSKRSLEKKVGFAPSPTQNLPQNPSSEVQFFGAPPLTFSMCKTRFIRLGSTKNEQCAVGITQGSCWISWQNTSNPYSRVCVKVHARLLVDAFLRLLKSIVA